MQSYETDGGDKYKSLRFQSWLTLNTNHLVIAFDSDSNSNGAGFKLEYEIIGNIFTPTLGMYNIQ